ncbi:C-type mannose receptor 2-like isoform X2 [Salvelinus alpinus]|uniref:C-type mannose receptor 2-like isoform X2 n=1 Tax=Salvelinus alpinus TaxID=8036 RepID=UPI0039FCC012
MDQTLFLLLVFSGLSILPSCLPHQFHFVNMKKTWTEAQNICRQNYTDLATIDEDMADMKKVSKTGSAWIGLYNNVWRWSLGDRELEGNGFWDDHQPNNDPNNNESCVYMLLNATWQNFDCSITFYFVCSDDKNATNKYILITEYKSWSDAHSYCQQYHTDLASVRNTKEMDAIKTILPDVTGMYRVWIGLKKSVGVWRWSDQSGSSFKSWETFKANMAYGSYQDGEFCGEVTFPGKLNYQDCTTNSNFICYDDELVLVSENKTWSEALWHCRDLDMELVSVHNQNIQHWVQQRAKKASTPFVWLGLRYTCTLDFWFWVNGEESCYHNWADGEGYDTIKEQCGNTGAIQRDGGQWVGKSETERFNFICSNSTDY